MRPKIIWAAIFVFNCNPFVTEFDDIEPAIIYTSSPIIDENHPADSLIVMTWNIRFGAGRIDWFGDHCGDRVILTSDEIYGYLNQIVAKISDNEVDILLLQEVDVESKRSAYIDQVQYILDNTHLNYGVFASMWQAQFIPSDGFGRVNTGNAILSRWKLKNADRIQLALRGDQDALTQMFYLRRNILKTEVELPEQTIFTVNTHLTAFATDDTKKKHVDKYIETLQGLDKPFVSGGDLNSLPPGAGSLDFCIEDRCGGEIFHEGDSTDVEFHKDGSYFQYTMDENEWLQELYDYFTPAIDDSLMNNPDHFTHSPGIGKDENGNTYLDRKLDYLFTNIEKVSGSTLQEYKEISDHIPVIMEIDLSGGSSE